jgi:hypothetical protein
MNEYLPDDAPHCGACATRGQPGCAVRDVPADLQGARLVLAAGGLFLVPAMLACVGALWGRATPTLQLTGACVGLLAGMGTVWSVWKVWRYVRRERG